MTRTTKIILALILLGVLGAIIFVVMQLAGDGEDAANPADTSLYFPSGSGDGGGEGAETPSLTGDPKLISAAETKLHQLIRDSIVGATLNKSGDKLLYYKRSGGNLFQMNLETRAEERVNQMTIVGIQEVSWSPAKETSFVGYLQNGEMKYLIHQIAASTTLPLPNKITSVGWSADGKLAAYTELRQDGLRVITISPTGKAQKTIFSSLIPDWQIHWKNSSSLLLSTAPTFQIEGISEALSFTGVVQPFISRRGLETLPAIAKDLVAVSSVTENGSFNPIEILNGKGVVAATSDARTSAKKCAWNASATALYCAVPRGNLAALPDSWYQGDTSFRDRLVKIDARTGNTLPFADTDLDAIGLFLDANESNLYFINKGDGTLWKFKLD